MHYKALFTCFMYYLITQILFDAVESEERVSNSLFILMDLDGLADNIDYACYKLLLFQTHFVYLVFDKCKNIHILAINLHFINFLILLFCVDLFPPPPSKLKV
jgi:hypothetical protein